MKPITKIFFLLTVLVVLLSFVPTAGALAYPYKLDEPVSFQLAALPGNLPYGQFYEGAKFTIVRADNGNGYTIIRMEKFSSVYIYVLTADLNYSLVIPQPTR